MATASSPAYAAGPLNKNGSTANVKAKKTKPDTPPPPSSAVNRSARGGSTYAGSGVGGRVASGPSETELHNRRAAAATKNQAVSCALAPAACLAATYKADALTPIMNGIPAAGGPAPGGGAAAAAAPPPQKTPTELAQEAIASITATSGKVGAGPNVKESGLTKMDAPVGYPVWLWVEENPGTISDSATDGDLTVSLSASISSVTYSMGDGTTKVCDGLGTKWSTSVTPASKSPTCGYIYQEMGRYTITATSTWEGTWSGGGESGTFELTSSATRPYLVGELQTIVR